ncbi:MAG: hypothetical protein AAFX44_16135 [Pseudomonadota bacterium]
MSGSYCSPTSDQQTGISAPLVRCTGFLLAFSALALATTPLLADELRDIPRTTQALAELARTTEGDKDTCPLQLRHDEECWRCKDDGREKHCAYRGHWKYRDTEVETLMLANASGSAAIQCTITFRPFLLTVFMNSEVERWDLVMGLPGTRHALRPVLLHLAGKTLSCPVEHDYRYLTFLDDAGVFIETWDLAGQLADARKFGVEYWDTDDNVQSKEIKVSGLKKSLERCEQVRQTADL